MSFLSVNNISVSYGNNKITDNVSFEINKGNLVGILGANGSGKTTLLKAICGILPHKGECILDAVRLENLSDRALSKIISYIPQRSGISIDISALDVVLMGFNPQLGLLEHPSQDMKNQASLMLEKVGLSGKENFNYMNLSEGQKQLCILARTFVSDSKLLLLDEPESALDFQYRHSMLSLLKAWIASDYHCAVVALHDPLLALNMCDKLVLISEGRVIDIIEPMKDSLEKTEKKLALLYGDVSLHKCSDRKGNSRLVMLKEDEA